MGTTVFRSIEEVMEKSLLYWNGAEVMIYLPKEDIIKTDTIVFDPKKDANTYNVVNNVIAFIADSKYYVIPNFFGIQLILDGLGFQSDKGLRVLFSTDFAVPEKFEERWVKLKRDMIETNHVFSRQFKHMPDGATPIDEKFLDLSYVYSTRFTEHVGKYNYDAKLIVFYYYDGKIYLTGNWAIIKELASHGFVRDKSLEIPVLGL